MGLVLAVGRRRWRRGTLSSRGVRALPFSAWALVCVCVRVCMYGVDAPHTRGCGGAASTPQQKHIGTAHTPACSVLALVCVCLCAVLMRLGTSLVCAVRALVRAVWALVCAVWALVRVRCGAVSCVLSPSPGAGGGSSLRYR